MKTQLISILTVALYLLLIDALIAQPSAYVDDDGVMRWTESNEEVTAFGVNYSMPFCTWMASEKLGHFNQEAIDADIYHLARMGLDGYRIHMWDRDIRDSDGNLVYNKQFQLFDYLLYQLKERDIKIVITAMNQFGVRYETWPAQENYLEQFISHVNPYTGIAYKDDPDIIGFEINNEPTGHSARPDQTREYIDRMTAAIRRTGCEKPLFYNVSHNVNQIEAFLADDIQGGTFQWYPTSLNGNHDLQGNYLPAVDQYVIPFADHPGFQNISKLIYELCPSDVGRSAHMYPAMARSLREAGFQFAAQFLYIPMNLAHFNARYTTHFLNMAYTPEKAMGMMIAKEAFHRLPLEESYGRYPNNNTFDVFSVDPEGLAEMVTDEKFFYTTNTETMPPNPEALSQVAGVGSSPIVNYPGTGTYFLDKLEDGIWRLEVMPDAIWVSDPHFVSAIDKEVSVIQWREWGMEIKLPDLGENFSIRGLNDGNQLDAVARGRQFEITPGAYLLTRDGKVSEWKRSDRIRNLRLDEFYAPEAHAKETYVVHEPPVETTAGGDLSLTAKIVSPEGRPDQVDLVIVKQRQHTAIPMEETSAYHYTAAVPSRFLETPGLLRYYITVGHGVGYETLTRGIDSLSSELIGDGEFETFPIKFRGNHPLHRRIRGVYTDFLPGDPYQVKILHADAPISIYESAGDWEKVTRKDSNINPDVSLKTGKIVTTFTLSGRNRELAYQHYLGDRIEMRIGDLDNKAELAVYGYALNDKPCVLGISLIMKDATVYGGNMVVQPSEGRYTLPLEDLELQKLRIIPFSIPQSSQFFNEPQFVETQEPSDFRLDEVESLQFIIYPENPDNKSEKADGLSIERISLEVKE